MNTVEKLCDQIKKSNSILCVGLDPRIDIVDSTPNAPKKEGHIYEQIIEHNESIISATSHQCACYKPNIAFYEQWGVEGWRALEWTMGRIPSHIPVILDAKRGDIGSTAEAYAYAAFQHLKVDAITLSPYMGTESIRPFLKYENALLFILSRTSNPHSDVLQKTQIDGIHSKQAVYLEISEQFAKLSDAVGFVVGANCYEELAAVRVRHPQRWILAPGIGAQGGDINEAIHTGARDDGLGLLPVVARGISQAKDMRQACEAYNERINEAVHRKTQCKKNQCKKTSAKNQYKNTGTSDGKKPLSHLKKHIIEKLFEYECIKIGDFVLKSGINSPFYIDLRRIISFPHLFQSVTQAYAEIIAGLTFDSIAGIPTAGLPFAASVSQTLQVPMIYPRIPKKPHGAGNLIEGNFKSGERALLLDDLITSGSSKKEVLEIFTEAGVITKDIVVLICRSYTAQSDMKSLGVALHFVLHIDDIISYGTEIQKISEEDAKRINLFLGDFLSC